MEDNFWNDERAKEFLLHFIGGINADIALKEFKKSKQKAWSPADAMRETDKIIREEQKSYEKYITAFIDRNGETYHREGNVFRVHYENIRTHKYQGSRECKGMGDGDTIVSVRNDAGVEFSIGDETQWGKIESFGTVLHHPDGDFIFARHKGYDVNIKDLYKPEPKRVPLFVTEDGVEKFEGDEEVWYVKQDFTTDCIDVYNGFKPSGKYHYFSTEEKALEFIRNNKPSISYQQLCDYAKNNMGNISLITVNKFLEHFKPK